MHKIYKYTNTSNGKIYIGQTSKTLNERAGKNGKNYCESNRFYAAIKKYGWESFVSEIIADNLTQDEANAFEIYYIDLFDSTNPDYGYNIQLGGNQRNQTDEGKAEISRKARERYKDRTKNPMYGKRHSPEAIEKMRGKKLESLIRCTVLVGHSHNAKNVAVNSGTMNNHKSIKTLGLKEQEILIMRGLKNELNVQRMTCALILLQVLPNITECPYLHYLGICMVIATHVQESILVSSIDYGSKVKRLSLVGVRQRLALAEAVDMARIIVPG